MENSKVFWMDMSAKPGNNILQKFKNLIVRAGIEDIDFDKKFSAIKIHFGEPGNLSYIRPNYLKPLVDLIKGKGGRPFLTDANTLYKGRRDNAVAHLESAYENGFSPFSTGCPVIIADGLKGTDYHNIEINKKHCKTAKIASAIAEADIIITMTHFKGHEMTGFGGALKNIGMGSGSIGGKLEMHSSSKPIIIKEQCVGCRICSNNCNANAITMVDKKAVINYDLCVGCGQCVALCQYGAASAEWDGDNSSKIVCEKIAEYSYAVLKNKPAFHINFLINVSPNCDCWNMNDIPVIPDVGVFASFDPVALDRACIDFVNKSPVNENSCLNAHLHEKNLDKFKTVYPTIEWSATLDYAEELGLGIQSYDLEFVK